MNLTDLFRKVASGLALFALAGAATAQEPKLFPGKKAPNLVIGPWYKGRPIKGFAPNQTYVVEFWATWCGPCREAIPHLTNLSHQYSGKVTFIGVDVMEAPDLAPSFIKKMGASMDYLVGYGGKYDGMFAGWLKPALQTQIPVAYLIHNGIVYWIGSPEDLAEPLPKAVSGHFNLTASRKAYFADVMTDAQDREVRIELYSAEEIYRAGNLKDALRRVDAVEKRFPSCRFETAMTRLRWWTLNDRGKAAEVLDKMGQLPLNDESFGLLLEFARTENETHPNDMTLKGRALQIVAERGKSNLMAQFGLVAYLRDTAAAPNDIIDGINRTLPLIPSSGFKQKDEAAKILNSWKKEAEARRQTGAQ